MLSHNIKSLSLPQSTAVSFPTSPPPTTRVQCQHKHDTSEYAKQIHNFIKVLHWNVEYAVAASESNHYESRPNQEFECGNEDYQE